MGTNFIALILLLITFNAQAFINQKCEHYKTGEIKSIRILSKVAPCIVEVERIINGKNIKYILYKSERSFEKCEQIAGKEIIATFNKDFSCGEEI